MNTTMREYFKVKGMELDDLPIVSKSSTGLSEIVVYKGGIVSKMCAKGAVGDPCTWMPDCARYVNKVLGGKVFNTSPANLSTQNNNCNTLIFERFGDIRVLWIVPNTERILDILFDGLRGPYGVGQYVGHTVMITLTDLGNEPELVGMEGYPTYSSSDMTPEKFKAVLEDRLGNLETALEVDFVKDLHTRLNSNFLGFDDTALYYRGTDATIYKLSIVRTEAVDEIREKLSYTVKSIIDDLETQRL